MNKIIAPELQEAYRSINKKYDGVDFESFKMGGTSEIIRVVANLLDRIEVLEHYTIKLLIEKQEQ